MPMDWVRGKTIGHGSFGAVSLAKPTNQTSYFPSIMAVKSCGLTHCESLMNERMMLQELNDCPEIIRCYGDSVTTENGVRNYNVMLEYASGGALSEKVKKNPLPENEVRCYTKSVLNGLKFIHRSGIVHCDIKLQNILLASNGAVKIADFGLAKRSTENGEFDRKCDIRGTPMYLAPETVVCGEQESASDVWAVGCLVTEMITGEPVWKCSDVGGLLMKIGVGAEIPEIPGKISEEGKDFIGKCFVKDPRKRWTAEMLLRHPFVSSVLFTEAENQISPRDTFDFPDWESDESCCSLTPEDVEFRCEFPAIQPAARMGRLLTCQRPDWSVSDSWVEVR